MRAHLRSERRSRNVRLWMAIAGVVGVAVVFYAFGTGGRSGNQDAPAAASSSSQSQRKKPMRAWNMALGEVVVVAQELGFAAKSGKDGGDLDPAKFVARIDSRLHKIRALYRQESEHNSALMGAIVLQLQVGATGEVLSVKELASRIADSEFKKTIVAEAAAWSFEDLVDDAVTIHCPLLFVREGMDITTLIDWEKSLRVVDAKVTIAPATKNLSPMSEGKAAETQTPARPVIRAINAPTEKMSSAPVESAAERVYQMKYASSLRRTPNFSAPPVARLASGTKIAVVNSRGDWLEIRTIDADYAGFVRKEFVSPTESPRKQ